MSLLEFLLTPQNSVQPLNQWELDCLSLSGSNKLLSQLQVLPGNYNNPGLSFQGNERTGLFCPGDEDAVSVSVFGIESHRFSYNDLSWFNNGNRTHLTSSGTTNHNITLPDKDGVVALTSDLVFTGQTGTPNSTTPIAYAQAIINGQTYYVPLCQ